MADPRTPRPPRSAGPEGGGNGGRGRGGGIAAEAAASSARGALLVVAAVIVGVVLLQVVGNDDTDTAKPPNPTNATASSSTTAPDGETTTPTDDGTNPEKDPSKLVVQVLNGRGVQGVAGQMTDALREQGYTSILDPADADPRTGDVVMCRKRFQREGTTLVTHVGPGTVLEAFPDPLPSTADDSVECLVILGSAAQ